jgi:hypothetical protein
VVKKKEQVIAIETKLENIRFAQLCCQTPKYMFRMSYSSSSLDLYLTCFMSPKFKHSDQFSTAKS